MIDNNVIRSFIAVEIPQEVKKSISRLQDQMKLSRYNFVKWVSPEGIHITLKFLGSIMPAKVDAIADAIESASINISPFNIEIGGLGAFPNINKARVLWLGIGGDIDKLIVLQQNIDNLLIPLGFSKEKRPFSPHITLARIRDNASYHDQQDFGKLISSTQSEINNKINIDCVNLMRSQLLPTGAVYSRLAEIKLVKS